MGISRGYNFLSRDIFVSMRGGCESRLARTCLRRRKHGTRRIGGEGRLTPLSQRERVPEGRVRGFPQTDIDGQDPHPPLRGTFSPREKVE